MTTWPIYEEKVNLKLRIYKIIRDHILVLENEFELIIKTLDFELELLFIDVKNKENYLVPLGEFSSACCHS